MRILLPAALAMAVLAIPAPAQHLKAEIQAGRTRTAEAPYRFAFAYAIGLGPLRLDVRAALTGGRPPEFALDTRFEVGPLLRF